MSEWEEWRNEQGFLTIVEADAAELAWKHQQTKVDSLKARLRAEEGKAAMRHQSSNKTIKQLQAKVVELTIGIRDHIGWADTAIDCDDLKILIGDMQEGE